MDGERARTEQSILIFPKLRVDICQEVTTPDRGKVEERGERRVATVQ